MKEASEDNDDWWDDLAQGHKGSIERGLKDEKEGSVTSHEDVKALKKLSDPITIFWQIMSSKMESIFLYKQENSFNMGEIEKKYLETLADTSKKFEKQKRTKEFEQAAKNFEKMVEKGEAVKRGNQLINIEDAPKKKYTFNS